MQHQGFTITTITPQVAKAIAVPGMFRIIEQFIKEGDVNDYTSFTHYNFFYTYPHWGTQWPDGKLSQIHRVHTKCLFCKWQPERNHAGVGSIYLLNNGIGNPEIQVLRGYKKEGRKERPILEWVPNTPQLSPMILLCQEHIKSYFQWKNGLINTITPPPIPYFTQLELFN